MMIYEKPSLRLESMSREELLRLLQTSPVMSLTELLTIMYRAANDALVEAGTETFLSLNDIQALQYRAALAAFAEKTHATRSDEQATAA